MKQRLAVYKKSFLFILLLILSTAWLNGAESYYTTKLYPNWFNRWGGLANYYGGYAVLTIDKYGRISIKDNFYSKDKELTEKHWITIDKISRSKDKENEIFMYITFHYLRKSDGKEMKEKGNGSFKFPVGNYTIYLQFNSSTANTIIDDAYAKEHIIIEFPEKTFIRRKKGDILVIRSNGKVSKGRRGLLLKLGDTVKTLDGTAEIVISGVMIIKLKPHTEFIIPKIQVPTPHKKIGFFKMTYGVLMAQALKEKESLKIAVPQAICGTRGTKFELSHDPKVMKSCVRVYEHSVWFSDLQKRKTVIVHEGEESCVVNGSLPSEPKSFTKNKKASAQNQLLFHGKTQDNFPATLLLKITKDGTISGIYSVKGSKFKKGKPCQLSARIPYRGKIEKSSLRAKGVLEATQVWCEGSKSIRQRFPATPFILSYKEGKGLLLDIGEQHYRVLFTKPAINPLKGIEK